MLVTVLQDGLPERTILMPPQAEPHPLVLHLSRVASRSHAIRVCAVPPGRRVSTTDVGAADGAPETSDGTAPLAAPPSSSQSQSLETAQQRDRASSAASAASTASGAGTILDSATAGGVVLHVPPPPLHMVRAGPAADHSFPGVVVGGETTRQHVLPPPTSANSPHAMAAASPFWYCASRAVGDHCTNLSLLPPLSLSNTSSALSLNYRCEMLTGGNAGAATGPTALADIESGTLPAGGEMPLRLSPVLGRRLSLRLQLEGFSWGSPALTLDEATLGGIRPATPLMLAVHAMNYRGQRVELHLRVQAVQPEEAGLVDDAGNPSHASGRGGGVVDGSAGLGASVGASRAAASTTFVISLLAPFEIRNHTGVPIALQASLDRGLTLLVPPAGAPSCPGVMVGSWGARQEYEAERRFLVRLAAAEDEEGESPPLEQDAAALGGSGQQSAYAASRHEFAWSSFLAVSRPVSVTLRSKTAAEVLHVVLCPEDEPSAVSSNASTAAAASSSSSAVSRHAPPVRVLTIRPRGPHSESD